MEKRMKVVVWTLVLFLVAIGVAIGAYINFTAEEVPPTTPPPGTDAPQACVAPVDLVIAIPTTIGSLLGLTSPPTPAEEFANTKAAAVALVNKMQSNGGIFVATDPATASSLFRVSVVKYGTFSSDPTVNDAATVAEMGTRTASQIIDAINSLTLETTSGFPGGFADLADGVKQVTGEFNAHSPRSVGGVESARLALFLAPSVVGIGTTEPAGGRPGLATINAMHALTDETHVISSMNDTGALEWSNVFRSIAEPATNYKSITSSSEMTAAAETFFDTEICTSGTGTRAGADLSLQVTADKTAINTNDEVTYTMTLLNSGPEGTSGVVVAGGVPTGTTIVGPTFSTNHFVKDGTWEIGAVASGETRELSYKVKVTAATGTVVNAIAEVSASSANDPDSTPNNGVVTEDDYSKLSLTVGGTGTGGSGTGGTGTGGTGTGGTGTGTGGSGTGDETPTAPATGFGTTGFATIALGLAILASYSGFITFRRRASAEK